MKNGNPLPRTVWIRLGALSMPERSVNEFAFRYNNRKAPAEMFNTKINRV